MKMPVSKLLLIFCSVGMALAKTEAEIKSWFMGRATLCIADHSVTDEEFLQMDKHIIPDSKNAKCFIACAFKQVGWMDDKGTFSIENAMKLAEEHHAEEPTKLENSKKLFELCKSVNEKSYDGENAACDRGGALAKCLVENAPKMGFNV